MLQNLSHRARESNSAGHSPDGEGLARHEGCWRVNPHLPALRMLGQSLWHAHLEEL